MASGSHIGQHSSRLKSKKPNSYAYCYCTEAGLRVLTFTPNSVDSY